MKSNGWIIYIYAKILPNFRVGIQANSSACDIFPQKQSFLKKEIVTIMYLTQWIIYIYAKILPHFLVGIQANSSAFDIFPQKQSFVENELICLRGSGETDIDALNLDDYTLSGFAFFC